MQNYAEHKFHTEKKTHDKNTSFQSASYSNLINHLDGRQFIFFVSTSRKKTMFLGPFEGLF